jgi:hypothetical protein
LPIRVWPGGPVSSNGTVWSMSNRVLPVPTA